MIKDIIYSYVTCDLGARFTFWKSPWWLPLICILQTVCPRTLRVVTARWRDNWFDNNYAINLAEEIVWHDMELFFNQGTGVKCLSSEPIVLQIELWTGQNGTSSDSSEMRPACQWHEQSEVICLSLFLPSINTLKKHTDKYNPSPAGHQTALIL